MLRCCMGGWLERLAFVIYDVGDALRLANRIDLDAEDSTESPDAEGPRWPYSLC